MGKFVQPFVRSALNYDMSEASLETAIDCGPESRTQQSFREEVDINTIVRRFGVTGQVPQSLKVPMQGDFENALDFRQSMDLIVQARESFMELPSGVRSRFHNDPAELLDFCQNPDNAPEARKLGLLVPERPAPVPPPPVAVRIVPEADPALPAGKSGAKAPDAGKP